MMCAQVSQNNLLVLLQLFTLLELWEYGWLGSKFSANVDSYKNARSLMQNFEAIFALLPDTI